MGISGKYKQSHFTKWNIAYKMKHLINELGFKFICTNLKLKIFLEKKKLMQVVYTYILKQGG